MTLRKYATFMQMNLQDSLVYRANAVVWMLVEALPAYTMLLVWTAVYRSTDNVGGYTLGDMAAYYLAATLLDVAITPHMEYNLSYEIRHGLLSHQLLRPWSYFWGVIVGETSWQVIKGSTNIPLFALAVWLFRDTVYRPELNLQSWGVLVVSAVLAYAINVGAKMTLAALSFWVVEPAGIIGIYDSLSWFLQGGVVPVDLFPHWLQTVSAALPFQYTLSFPLMILLQRLPAGALLPGLLWQLFWAVFMMSLAGIVWRRGTRVYAAVGG